MASEKTTKIRGLLILTSLIFGFFVFSASKVLAADLYLSPGKASYKIGDTFTVNAIVDSGDTAINAVSGQISFSSDKLQAVSVSNSGSIIKLWVKDPSFSNETGRVTFEGIIFNPGYKGSAGKVLSVKFKVIAAGSANISFYSAAVLANDGQGTNVLKGLSGSTIIIPDTGIKAEAPKIVETSVDETIAINSIPRAPEISSPSHGNQNLWYNNNNPEFTWDLPAGVSSISWSLDHDPSSVPSSEFTSPGTGKQFTLVDDGLWYFHLRFKNKKGWGPASYYPIKIDATLPSNLEIKESPGSTAVAYKRDFAFGACDLLSGLDHFEVRIDGGEPEEIKSIGLAVYQTPALKTGKHQMLVKAFDVAGNFVSASTEFEINRPVSGVSQSEGTRARALNLSFLHSFNFYIIVLFALLVLVLLVFIVYNRRWYLAIMQQKNTKSRRASSTVARINRQSRGAINKINKK